MKWITITPVLGCSLLLLTSCATPTFQKTGNDITMENAGYKKITKTAPDGTVTVTETVIPVKNPNPSLWQSIMSGMASWFTQ